MTKTITVNYNDPQWQTIDNSRYAYVGDVRQQDYPIRGTGTKDIEYVLLEFESDPNDDEVIARMKELNCRQPDRAEAGTVIRSFTSEQLYDHPIIALVGLAVQRYGVLGRAYVSGCGDGVRLDWGWTEGRWSQDCRFLVVCKPLDTRTLRPSVSLDPLVKIGEQLDRIANVFERLERAPEPINLDRINTALEQIATHLIPPPVATRVKKSKK